MVKHFFLGLSETCNYKLIKISFFPLKKGKFTIQILMSSCTIYQIKLQTNLMLTLGNKT